MKYEIKLVSLMSQTLAKALYEMQKDINSRAIDGWRLHSFKVLDFITPDKRHYSELMYVLEMECEG